MCSNPSFSFDFGVSCLWFVVWRGVSESPVLLWFSAHSCVCLSPSVSSFTSCVLLSFLGSSPSASWLLLLFLLVSSSDSSSSEGAVLERSPSPGLSALLPGLGWVLPLTSDLSLSLISLVSVLWSVTSFRSSWTAFWLAEEPDRK